MRGSRAVRSLKNVKFNNFRNGYKTDEKSFRKLISELYMLLCLAHHEDQSNHALCTALWSAVERCPWYLQAMTKSEVGNYYPTINVT